jgi:hypothetical protein
MEAPQRQHQDSLHYNNLYPTSADAFAAPQGNSTTNCVFFLYYSGIRRFYHSPELGGLNCFFYFLYSPLISHGNRRKKQTAPSTAKGKRKCDDTNSTYEHTRTPLKQQHKVNICCGLWEFFFPSESLYLFFLFYLLLRHGRKRRTFWAGIHTIEGSRWKGRKERKKEMGKCPRVAGMADTYTLRAVLWQLFSS